MSDDEKPKTKIAEVILFATYEAKDAAAVEAWRTRLMESSVDVNAPFSVSGVSTMNKEADDKALLARGVVEVDCSSVETVERLARVLAKANNGTADISEGWMEAFRRDARAVLAELQNGGETNEDSS